MDVQGVVPDDSRIRFRPSRAQQAPFVLIAVMLGFQVDLYFRTGAKAFLLMPAFLAAEYLYLCFGVGITLTADHAVVHNVRRRKIAWADVQCIRIESYLGSRTIVIYEASGRHTRLRAPIRGFLSWDRRFDEKFHTIGQWWLAHRGAAWTPVSRSA